MEGDGKEMRLFGKNCLEIENEHLRMENERNKVELEFLRREIKPYVEYDRVIYSNMYYTKRSLNSVIEDLKRSELHVAVLELELGSDRVKDATKKYLALLELTD